MFIYGVIVGIVLTVTFLVINYKWSYNEEDDCDHIYGNWFIFEELNCNDYKDNHCMYKVIQARECSTCGLKQFKSKIL